MSHKKARTIGGKQVSASETTDFYLVKNQDSHPAANKSYMVSRGQLADKDGKKLSEVVSEVRNWFCEATGATEIDAEKVIPDNGEVSILLTRRGFCDGLYRAMRNPEDVPTPTFLTDVLEEIL